MTAKRDVEASLAREPYGERYLDEREIGPPDELFGSLDPRRDDVGVRGDGESATEGAREAGGAEADQLGEHLHRELAIEVVVDMGEHSP